MGNASNAPLWSRLRLGLPSPPLLCRTPSGILGRKDRFSQVWVFPAGLKWRLAEPKDGSCTSEDQNWRLVICSGEIGSQGGNPGYNLVPGDHCLGRRMEKEIQDEPISSSFAIPIGGLLYAFIHSDSASGLLP